MNLLKRIERRLTINEEHTSDIKRIDNPQYDRKYAEDILYHTIGPLTDHPRWASEWKSNNPKPDDFIPGGPAPKWSPNEVIIAMAGDPSMLFRDYTNPRSPHYGGAGAPILRAAKRTARRYGRSQSDVEDLYATGIMKLSSLLQKGADAGRSPFISFAMPRIEGAMRAGVGSDKRSLKAIRDLKSVLKTSDPLEVRRIAEEISPNYREERSTDHDEGNPYGSFSPDFYNVVTAYADALESENEEAINVARENVEDLISKIEDYGISVRGASGGGLIAAKDRSTITNVTSVSGIGRDEADYDIEQPTSTDIGYDTETVYRLLELALETDTRTILRDNPEIRDRIGDINVKPNYMGGRLTATEFRYVLRSLGPFAADYPGKGTIRSNLQIPRDGKGWWQPGEDPEIEPIPDNGIWHSIWSREGYQRMGSTAIAQEMTQEVKEFEKLNIPTARQIKIKKKGKKTIEEVTSKISVNTALKNALFKLRVITEVYKSQLGLDESFLNNNGLLILDDIDRSIFLEAMAFVESMIRSSIIFEKAPPGWEGTVRAMKQKHPDKFGKGKGKLNPYAIAWSMYKKGAKPNYVNKGGKPKKKSK